jgi:hypothetical protein
VAHHLLDEEGIALGPFVDCVHEPGGRLVTRVRGDQYSDVVPVQALERYPFEQPVTTQVGDQLGERAIGTDPRLLAIGADDQQRRFVRCSDHVPEQVEGGPVGPVEIVQHEHEWGSLRCLAQELRDRVEQQVAPRLRVGRLDSLLRGQRSGQLRNEPGELVLARAEGDARPVECRAPRVVPQRFDDRLVGDERLFLAAGIEDCGVLVGRERELAHEARLSDTRFADDQDEPPAARAGLLAGGSQDAEFLLPPDERGALARRKQAGARNTS